MRTGGCPKCGAKHVRAGTCVMCGAIVPEVAALESLPLRACPSCGRQRRFAGACCVDCAAALALGAVSIRENLARVLRDQNPIPGYCPALAALDQLADEFRARRERRRQQQREARRRWREKNRDLLRQKRLEMSDEERAKKRARNLKYISSEKGKARRREYRKSPEQREKARAYAHEYNQRPEVKARHAERMRKWRASLSPERRAEMRQARRQSPNYQIRLERDRERWRKLMSCPLLRHLQRERHREYHNRPEVREKKLAYMRRYYLDGKLERENAAIAAAKQEMEAKMEEEKKERCTQKTEVYQRICGFFRPVTQWDIGKKAEFADRVAYDVGKCLNCEGDCACHGADPELETETESA